MELLRKMIAVLDPGQSGTLSQKLGTAAVVVGALIALLTQVQAILCKLTACAPAP